MSDAEQDGKIITITDITQIAYGILIFADRLDRPGLFHEVDKSLMGSRCTEVVQAPDSEVPQLCRSVRWRNSRTLVRGM